MSALAEVNRRLARAGRRERLVRGRGYYYLRGGDAAAFRESGFYGFGYPLASADTIWPSVAAKFAEEGVAL